MSPETVRLCQQLIRMARGSLTACEDWLRARVARGEDDDKLAAKVASEAGQPTGTDDGDTKG
jgi:hypothetical protein